MPLLVGIDEAGYGPLLGPLLLSKFSPAVCALVIGLLFVIPVSLYQLGLKRWKTIEYGA